MPHTLDKILTIYQENELYAEEFLNVCRYESLNHTEMVFHITYNIPKLYKQIADEDHFSGIWFSLGMLISNKIGEIIRIIQALQNFINLIDKIQAKVLHEGLYQAMRAVFKNMVTLEKTYRIVGIRGLELLNHKSKELVSSEALFGFKTRAILEGSAKKIAVEMQLKDYKSPEVLEELYKSQHNIDLFKKSAYFLVENEQKNVLQKIYDTKYFDHIETIGQILSNKRHPCPIKLVGTLGISSIKIVNITVKLGTRDLSSLIDRMSFAYDLIEIISQHQTSSIGLLNLKQQREEIVDAWHNKRSSLIHIGYSSIINVGSQIRSINSNQIMNSSSEVTTNKEKNPINKKWFFY